jgi:hypothetical protein
MSDVTVVQRNSANSAITLGSWQFVTATWSGTGSQTSIQLYVNGVETSYSGGTNSTSNTLHTDAAKNLLLGNEPLVADDYVGQIDEVRLYGRVLSPQEVLDLYNSTPSPVAHWNLDENSSTTANDSSANENSGTLTNSPSWVTGKYGNAVSFAGSNQHITRADDPDLDFEASNAFTLETWFKHGTASATETLISKLEGTGTDGGYKLKMESDGDITCETDDDDADTTIDDTATTTLATYDNDNWHHVAVPTTLLRPIYSFISTGFGQHQTPQPQQTHSQTTMLFSMELKRLQVQRIGSVNSITCICTTTPAHQPK